MEFSKGFLDRADPGLGTPQYVVPTFQNRLDSVRDQLGIQDDFGDGIPDGVIEDLFSDGSELTAPGPAPIEEASMARVADVGGGAGATAYESTKKVVMSGMPWRERAVSIQLV